MPILKMIIKIIFFSTGLEKGFGSIEADVYAVIGKPMVTHDKDEI